MQNNKIIFGVNRSFDFYKQIIKNLEFYGFEVIDISYDEYNFKITSWVDKLIHAFKKFIFNDYEHKAQLKIKKAEKDILQKIDSIKDQADYALIIRSDIYPLEVVKKINAKTKKMVGYQWDGLHRFPSIYNHIPFYDNFFVFDATDLKTPNVKLTHNFYLDFEENNVNTISQDFFFVGTYIKKRMPKIESLLSVLDELKMTYKVILISNQSVKTSNKKIEIKNEFLTYNQYLMQLKSSNICLDFLNIAHNGLSFRTFEALYYDKKLITTNREIKKYNFYHPNNIFVLEENNVKELKEFLKKPYIKIEDKIKLKYGFKNWIDTILNS